MGFILVGGVVFLAGVVWKKMSADIASVSAAKKSADCPGGHVDLKGRGMVIESAVDGQMLRLTFERKGGGSDIVLIDICSGKVTGALTVDTDPVTLQ